MKTYNPEVKYSRLYYMKHPSVEFQYPILRMTYISQRSGRFLYRCCLQTLIDISMEYVILDILDLPVL